MTSTYDRTAGDWAPIGAVGASGTGAARPVPLPALPRLDGRPIALTAPARVYVCGITPYDVTHLGHAATFVWADTLARVLQSADVPTRVSRNVTDVDDVLTAAAARDGADYATHALLQEYRFEQDMAALAVRAPDHAPRARHHVDHVIRLAAALLDRGAAYERDGTVHLRGGHVPAEAGVPHDTALRLLAEHGDQPDDPNRDDPFDVPVWRRSGLSDPAWPSPWGPGRPGWHAECAAMAIATLGGTVDVLVGGQDLAFPHQAYQAAIAGALTGGPLTRATLRVGEVRLDGVRMAKSTGNLVLVSDLLREHPGPVLRTMLLDRPWQRAWDFRPSDLDAATARLDALYRAAGSTSATAGTDGVDAVRATLLDDLDVPAAMDAALQHGGPAARLLVRTLALD